MTIKIITDSTSDLPESVAHQHGITVLPCYINIGDKSYLDGVDILRREFYENLPTYPILPQTASPNQQAFENAYRQAAAEGATQVISIHVAGAFSSVVDTAHAAANAVADALGLRVSVVDSGSVTMGIGFMALYAARAAAAGRSAAEIVASLLERAQRTILFAGLDTVEYLRRSGRASRLQASLSAFLHIFPVLRVHMGDVQMERIRTHARAFERLLEMAEECAPLEELAVMHTNCLEKAEQVRKRLEHLLPGRSIWVGEAAPAIGTHVGPNGLGVVCVRAA